MLQYHTTDGNISTVKYGNYHLCQYMCIERLTNYLQGLHSFLIVNYSSFGFNLLAKEKKKKPAL
jgi:hypothetical protein